jgi:glycosidase
MTALTLQLSCISKRVPSPRAPQEFHITRKIRDAYGFDDGLFSVTGNVVFANFLATRIFAQKMNEKRDLGRHPDKAVLPAQINAMGLIDEILHYVSGLYREENGTDLWARALDFISLKIGRTETDEVLARFGHHFPTVDVYRGRQSEEDWLSGSTDGVSHRETAFEEVLLLSLANDNQAFGPFLELFDDKALRKECSYREFLKAAHDFFDTVPAFGPDRQNLLDMLRAPAIAVPHSLQGQLQYMQERWGLLLGKFLLRLLGSLDFLKEEGRLFWAKNAGPGDGQSQGYEHSLTFTGQDHEPERFSSDKDWMPKVILLAKSTLVWLDQLSKQYGRDIRTLDAIPDEELDQMAARGFNALWLIGLWERSLASKRIKQMCGNPEAEASAYSLHDYAIANELGGWGGLDNLRDRCRRRGIRVASDMVPNHTAMDSRWVSEHPDWFLQLDHSPFPGYRFDGPDLSRDPRVEIKLEDHYYDRSDAAVVFRHIDKGNGRHRYIYHGNDGTSMPWNDTAQLDYLNPATREAVIQVVLEVARNFPIIRFDAAMTLAKKHIQRLWYPIPGTGGDIATRSEHAMSKEAFDKAIPEEFWREVVDRVAKEVPDTLLLAEAFWMMEGYFVRTLGMHRVYNSAFMHMFKKEENEKYRWTIKNTIEFDPDILKRFVNFMNNPDEETAAVQFGTGDKYFGVATVLATMPGTPMFGHGQVEGFKEKYGMEYRKAYWDEKVDRGLVERHEREIFPLLHRRYLFAEVRRFRLYDLYNREGGVNQNVFAYSNGTGTEHALVFFNNTWERVGGWIKDSSPYVEKMIDGSKAHLHQTLAQALGLTDMEGKYLVMREQGSGLWYLRRSNEVHHSGLFVELEGYGKQVFLDIHEVSGQRFGDLCSHLGGAGVPDLSDALLELAHPQLYSAFTHLLGREALPRWVSAIEGTTEPDEGFWSDLGGRAGWLYAEARRVLGSTVDPAPLAAKVVDDVKTLVLLGTLDWTGGHAEVLCAWALLGRLGELIPGTKDYGQATRSVLEEWGFDRRLSRVWTQRGLSAGDAGYRTTLVKLQGLLTGNPDLKLALQNAEVQALAGVNSFQGTAWIDKGGLEALAWWTTTRKVLEVLGAGVVAQNRKDLAKAVAPVTALGEQWLAQAQAAGYRYDVFLASLGPKAAPKKAPAKKAAVKKAAKAPAKKAPPKKATAKMASPKKP